MYARDQRSSRADTCDDSAAGDPNASTANDEDTKATVLPRFGDEDTNVDLYPDDSPVTVTVDAAVLGTLARDLVSVGEQLSLAQRELDAARARIATLEERFARLTPP